MQTARSHPAERAQALLWKAAAAGWAANEAETAIREAQECAEQGVALDGSASSKRVLGDSHALLALLLAHRPVHCWGEVLMSATALHAPFFFRHMESVMSCRAVGRSACKAVSSAVGCAPENDRRGKEAQLSGGCRKRGCSAADDEGGRNGDVDRSEERQDVTTHAERALGIWEEALQSTATEESCSDLSLRLAVDLLAMAGKCSTSGNEQPRHFVSSSHSSGLRWLMTL